MFMFILLLLCGIISAQWDVHTLRADMESERNFDAIWDKYGYGSMVSRISSNDLYRKTT
jgi:hypothetical protein